MDIYVISKVSYLSYSKELVRRMYNWKFSDAGDRTFGSGVELGVDFQLAVL